MPAVRLCGQNGVQSGRLRDLSPWGLGVNRVSGPPQSVGSRVQVAFGFGRWAISRLAEVRRWNCGSLGLALADPLPRGLWSQLLDLSSPQLSAPAVPEPSGAVTNAGRLDPAETLLRSWISETGDTVGQVAIGRWIGPTWVAFATTVRAMHPQALRCWRDLYRFAATAPVYSDGAGAHLVAFHELGGPWHDRFTEAFVSWLDDPHRALSLRWSQRRFATRKTAPGSLRLEPATDAERDALSDRLGRRFDPLVRRALAWDRAGLVFRQEAVFAVRGPASEDNFVLVDPSPPRSGQTGEPTAFAWLIPRDPNDTSRTLVEAARTAAGRCGFEHATVLSTAPTGEPTGLMVWSAEGLQQYDHYLTAAFGDPERELSVRR